MGVVSVIWRVPESQDPEELLTTGARILSQIDKELPVYHTRQMRWNFTKKVTNIQGLTIPKYVLWHFYTDLTGDSTQDQNPAIDERLRQAFIGEDPELIVDLQIHANKGRPSNTFKTFFNAMEKKVDEIAAVDERRHGVAHLSKFISLRDMIEQVTNECPEWTLIPSETTILFAFTPKNVFVNTAKLYKGCFALIFKVQSRQLQASHVDAHYCAAQFRYMREYTIKLRDITTFLCEMIRPKSITESLT